MAVYVVDRDLPGITQAGLAALQNAASVTCRQFRDSGAAIDFLQSVFIPGEQRCLCLFEAADEALVAAVNEAAGLPFTRIVPALRLTPERDGSTSDDTGR